MLINSKERLHLRVISNLKQVYQAISHNVQEREISLIHIALHNTLLVSLSNLNRLFMV